MSAEGDGQVVPQSEVVPVGEMTVETALKEVLRVALINDGLARGLREAVRCLDSRQAHMCVLAESCEEKEYLRLIEALCAEYKINLIKVADAKKLGEMVGLCKIDKNGVAQKVVACACVVVKGYGEETQALSFLNDYFKRR